MSDPCKYCGFMEHHPGDKLGDSIPGRTGLLGEHGEGYGGWWGQGKEGGLEGRRDRKGEDPAALREPALGREASEPRTGPAAGGWGPGASKQGRAVARLTQVTRGWSPSLPMTGILPLQGPVGERGVGTPEQEAWGHRDQSQERLEGPVRTIPLRGSPPHHLPAALLPGPQAAWCWRD